MQVKRYEPQKKTNPLLIGCGCLFGGIMLLGALAVVAMLFFAPQIKSLVLQGAGFEDVGTVDTVLNSTVEAVPQLENPQPVENVVLNAGDFSQTLNTSGAGYQVVVGEANEETQLQISFDETALLEQCRQFTPICSAESSQIRNASFDLKPNAVIVRGQFEIQPNFWQEAGLVLLVQNQTQLSVLGLEVGGSIFTSDSPDLNALIAEAGSQVNALLQSMSAQAAGESYSLSNIIIDENTMTLIMR